MAKVTSPHAGSESRGRVGGLVHNVWRGISYVKAASSPAQPRTARQLKIRAWTTMLVRYWGTTLSDAERGYWNDYAATHPDVDWTGNPKRLTGLNWFVRLSIRLLDLGQAIVRTPPAIAGPDAPAAFAAANGILQSVLTWTVPTYAYVYINIYDTGVISKGQIPKMERAKHKAYGAASSGTQTITALSPGRHSFFARMIDVTNGLASPWVTDPADITAT